jgi:hypothetical protein
VCRCYLDFPCLRAECAVTSLKRLGEQTFPSTCQVLEPFWLAINRSASSRLIGYMARVRKLVCLGGAENNPSAADVATCLTLGLGEGSNTTRTGRPLLPGFGKEDLGFLVRPLGEDVHFAW